MKLFKLFVSIITSLLLFANVSLAEKWDMALAYGAGNFHSANATEFAKNNTEVIIDINSLNNFIYPPF